MLPSIDLPMLGFGMRRRRYFWREFDHMINHFRDILKFRIGLDLALDHDPETMRHLSSDDLLGNWGDPGGRLYVTVANIFSGLGYHYPTASI